MKQMKRKDIIEEVEFYTTPDNKKFAMVRITGKRTGISAEYDTATFPHVYYYPHVRLFSKINYVPRFEQMARGCPCLTCENLIAGSCAMLERGQCTQIDDWERTNARRRTPKQMKLF